MAMSMAEKHMYETGLTISMYFYYKTVTNIYEMALPTKLKTELKESTKSKMYQY